MKCFHLYAKAIFENSAPGLISAASLFLSARNPLSVEGFLSSLYTAITQYNEIEEHLFTFESANSSSEFNFFETSALLQRVIDLNHQCSRIHGFLKTKQMKEIFLLSPEMETEFQNCKAIRNAFEHRVENLSNSKVKTKNSIANGWFCYQITGFLHKQTPKEFWCRLGGTGRMKDNWQIDLPSFTSLPVDFQIDNLTLNFGEKTTNLSLFVYNLMEMWLTFANIMYERLAQQAPSLNTEHMPPAPFIGLVAKAKSDAWSELFRDEFTKRLNEAKANKFEVMFTPRI